jgi:CheY-like chemotaxis protein
VRTGNKAIHALERDPFDLVVTDLIMHGIDGVGVLEAVRRNLLPYLSRQNQHREEIAHRCLIEKQLFESDKCFRLALDA